MIVRIVKMQFREDEVQCFKKVFDASKDKIRAFPGIVYLELLQDQKDQCTFFTYSQWESEEDLEKYRNSALFKNTWAQTKPLFSTAAQAWSNDIMHRLP